MSKRNIGLKLPSPPSSNNEPKYSAEQFDRMANTQFDKIQDYKNQIWELSVKFKSLVESKILPENKGVIQINLEKEALDKLVTLAIMMNADQSQDEGSGSVTLNMLLMKCMLIQRDIINKVCFETDSLKKTVAFQQNTINNITLQIDDFKKQYPPSKEELMQTIADEREKFAAYCSLCSYYSIEPDKEAKLKCHIKIDVLENLIR